MKKILVKSLAALLLLTLTLCALAGCKDSAVPDGMQEVTAGNYGELYHLYVPETWISQASTGVSGARANTDDSNVAVTLSFPGEELTFEAYWNACCAQYEKVYTDLQVDAEKCVDTTLGGKNARQYVFSGTLDGVQYKYLQIFAAKDNTIYTLTYTATAERFDTHLETVESIRAAFVFA